MRISDAIAENGTVSLEKRRLLRRYGAASRFKQPGGSHFGLDPRWGIAGWLRIAYPLVAYFDIVRLGKCRNALLFMYVANSHPTLLIDLLNLRRAEGVYKVSRDKAGSYEEVLVRPNQCLQGIVLRATIGSLIGS